MVARKRLVKEGTIKMRVRALALGVLLAAPSPAFAGPITLTTPGVWTTVNAPPAFSLFSLFSLSSTPEPERYWEGLSWDCPTCGLGFLINAYESSAIEYLNDGSGSAVGFRFTQGSVGTPTYFGGMTSWTNGVFGQRDDGVFTYDSGTGHVSNSWDNPEQYALLRIVGVKSTHYFMGIEDILLSEPLNDRDYNDYITTFTEINPVPAPEPSTLVLLGSAGAIAGLRRARARRRARQSDAR
jgi:hypothetical protein